MEASKNLSDQKLALMKRLMEVDNEATLDEIQAFMDEIESSSSSSRIAPPHHRVLIAQGLADIEAGRLIPLKEFKKKFSKYDA